MAGGIIRAIAFDWDGTLVDSMNIKAQAFGESLARAYSELAGKEHELEQMFTAAGGIPRKEHLKRVQEKFRLEPLSTTTEQAWSDEFTELYLAKPMPLFPDVVPVFQALKKRGYTIVISSSVPQGDLEKTVAQYPEITGQISLILGTQDNGKFRKGKPHVGYICQKFRLSEAERAAIVFVGDTPQDMEYAKEAGVRGWLVSRPPFLQELLGVVG